MGAYIIFYCVILLVFSSFVFGEELVVNTTLGLVRGVRADDGDYTMYLGIPFGKVRKDNPFGEALPHPKFDDIFDANDDSAICPQEEEFNHTIVGTLDCLHLNIHVPNTANSNNLRPVFVWIFGGGFSLGFYGRFLYGPKFLVRHDIIFVTINYRLGPFGFMCLDIPEVSGNQGLKDQLLALKWIQDNIQNFGGDPNKITIAGNSAGSMSVDYHLTRKHEDPKLFHQALLQSGTTLSPGSLEHNRDAPLQLAKHLGFETDDTYKALDFLAQVDPLEIIKSGFELEHSYGVCIEKEFENVDAFLTENVTEITIQPAVKDMPIMLGFNNDEVFAVTLTDLPESAKLVVPLYMSMIFDPTHTDFNFMVTTTQQFYFGDEEIDNDQKQNYADFLGDLGFVYPTFRTMQRYLDSGVGKMYLYKFSYDGKRNFVKHRENYVGGEAYHADELGYLFDISYMPEPNAEDQVVVDAMTTMWANFVKFSDPTPATSDLIPHKWHSISEGSPYHYMNIDLQLSVGTRPFQQRMAFLDLLYYSSNNTQRSPTRKELVQFVKKSNPVEN